MGADAAEEEQFGPYLVYERLGVGGMATVHRALERGVEGFERVVALKRLLPHLAEDASFIKSFVREAKLASLLSHVNIVQIYELGRVGTEYFISMEYIDGRDVRRVLRHARKVTGPPPIHITVGLLAQLCEALDYAHHRTDDEGQPLGLVHRDVSPSNLLVTSTGHLKVIDFGIAKAQSSQLRTQTGRVKGKLAYMAPEAVAGKDLDSRSDLWAAGVILHELLTARPLFASKNEYQTLLKVQRGDIMPPSTFNQACPPEVDAIVFKALARDPDERFSSAGEMREELLRVRRTYQLQSGYRDIAAWLEWAFSLESPAGFAGNTGENTGSSLEPGSGPRHKTPRPPRNRDEDEAVEMVWGAAEGEGGPLVLDDIPDVSGKHLSATIAAVKPDEVDEDMPTPKPLPRPVRGTIPNVNVAPHGSDPGVGAKRGSDQLPAQRTTPEPSRPNRTTAPGIAAARLAPPSTESSRKRETLAPPAIPRPRDTAPPPAPPRARQTQAPPLRESEPKKEPSLPRAESSVTTEPSGHPITDATDPARPLNAEELFGADQDDSFDTVLARQPSAGDSMPTIASRAGSAADSMPTMLARAGSAGDSMPTIAVANSDVEPVTSPDGRPLHEPPAMPRVRFSKSVPPQNVPVPLLQPTRRAQTQTNEPQLRATVLRKSADQIIGASMVARSRPRRAWLVLLAIVIAGAAATGITLYVTRGQDSVVAVREPQARIPAHVMLTIKFVTEPSDAEIRIEGQTMHTGTPWAASLEPGVHQIEIRRAGYKSWLTSLELSASDGNQLVRVALEQLGNGAATGDATLAISTTPRDLDVVLDGQVLPQRTPIKVSIKPGAHSVAVRQNGIEVWHQNLMAETAVDYEYNPSLTEEKQRERNERAQAPKPQIVHAPRPAPIEKDKSEGSSEPPIDPPKPDDKDVTPAAPDDKPEVKEPKPDLKPDPKPEPPKPAVVTKPVVVVPPPPPVVPAKPPAPAPIVTQARPTGPVLVAPSAVTKLSGETPSIGKSKNVDIPPVVAAKVCIDVAGNVSSVDALTKLDRIAKQGLVEGLMSWKYVPYKKDGGAAAACFVVTMRVK
ncbi:MAG: serine/threonine protein kinase [Myxococcales bacterium]|nr:serine/threonine protein kinase [Myxococcales bacterium]